MMLKNLVGKECVAFKWNRGPYKCGTAALIVRVNDVEGRMLNVDVVGCIKLNHDDNDVYNERKDVSKIAYFGLHKTNGLYINFGELGPLTLFETFKNSIDESRIVRW